MPKVCPDCGYEPDPDTHGTTYYPAVAAHWGTFVLVNPAFLGVDGEARVLDLVAHGLAVMVDTHTGEWLPVMRFDCEADGPGRTVTVDLHPGSFMLTVTGPTARGPWTVTGGNWDVCDDPPRITFDVRTALGGVA